MALVNYSASNIKGLNGKAIYVDEDFVPYADLFNALAKKYGIQVIVTSSKRNNLKVAGAIVEPAKMSNHLIGHAFDCNFILKNIWWDSEKLNTPTGKMLDFINEVKGAGLRWGGDFKKDGLPNPDPVHFDSGLNVRSPKVYIKKYNEYFN